MQLITSDRALPPRLLDDLKQQRCPAIVMDSDYIIIASNEAYAEHFGAIPKDKNRRCFQVSHGYDVPCDQAGEDCPLAAASLTHTQENVLHIHQTPQGKAYVDVTLIPYIEDGEVRYFLELLKPLATPKLDDDNVKTLIGKSPAFQQMSAKLAKVAGCGASVLLLGESGTGKELAALNIHQTGQRKHKPLVTLECAGLTDTLFESELFGHVKGAFTGAQNNKKGLVEEADGGTLFLDEIGDVPLSMQVKLLRLLETGTYRPVGSAVVKHANFRLICATHLDITSMIERGQFRQDLFYRINVFPVRIPPLRERKEDIEEIAKALVGRMKTKRPMHFTQGAVERLQRHHFPGNIRELRNILARAVVLSETNIIDQQLIDDAFTLDATQASAHEANSHTGPTKLHDLKTAEQLYLQDMYHAFNGDKARTAKTAGISLRSLYRKINLSDN